jgi:hypothetical protein
MMIEKGSGNVKLVDFGSAYVVKKDANIPEEFVDAMRELETSGTEGFIG